MKTATSATITVATDCVEVRIYGIKGNLLTIKPFKTLEDARLWVIANYVIDPQVIRVVD